MHIAIYLDPQKQSAIERFVLLGEFVMRGSAVYIKANVHAVMRILIS